MDILSSTRINGDLSDNTARNAKPVQKESGIVRYSGTMNGGFQFRVNLHMNM